MQLQVKQIEFNWNQIMENNKYNHNNMKQIN